MGGEAGQGAAFDDLGVASGVMPSSRPYLMLAEAGFLCQVALALVLALAESIASLVHFAFELLAFNSAANILGVRLFKYAVYLLAIGFVVEELGGTIDAAVIGTQRASPGMVGVVDYGLGALFSAATSLVAAVDFHRLRRIKP